MKTSFKKLNTLNELNLKLYEHEYMGTVTGTGGEVFTNVKIRPITDDEIKNFDKENRGIDFGFAMDPSHIIQFITTANASGYLCIMR